MNDMYDVAAQALPAWAAQRAAGHITTRPIPSGPRTVAEVLDRVQDRSQRAVVARSGSLTYDELDRLANQTGHALRGLGVNAGDRVGASLPNDLDIVVAFMGAMRIGAIWVGIPRALSLPEQAFISHDVDLAVLLADEEIAHRVIENLSQFSDGLRVVVVNRNDPDAEFGRLVAAAPDTRIVQEIDPHAPAAISYTSGTTGRPKGVVHSQHNLLVPGAVLVDAGEFPPGGPVSTSAQLTILNLFVLVPLTAFQAGVSCVLIDSNTSAGVAEWIEREQIMHLTAVPTVYHDMASDPNVTSERLSSLKRARSGGAATTEALREKWLERFGTRLTSSLAMTEAPTYVTREDPNEPRLVGSLGRAVGHVEVTIEDSDGNVLPVGEPGEICIGPASTGEWAGVYSTMLGYWNLPDETARTLRGGRLHTGDIGKLDALGNLHLVDRKSSMIIRGGSNVYPAEIEAAVCIDTRVAECVVVPRPDERMGELIVAFVRLAIDTDAPAPDAAQLREHCSKHLARYKIPDEFRFVDDFPRSPLGKTNRSALITAVAAEAQE